MCRGIAQFLLRILADRSQEDEWTGRCLAANAASVYYETFFCAASRSTPRSSRILIGIFVTDRCSPTALMIS